MSAFNNQNSPIAMEWLEKSTKLGDVDAAIYLGQIYQGLGNLQKVLSIYRSISKIEPTKTAWIYAELLFKFDEIEQAIEWFEIAESAMPNNAAHISAMLGSCYSKLNRISEAEACFLRSIEQGSDESIHRLGWLYVRGDRYIDALERFAGTDDEDLIVRGYILLKLKDAVALRELCSSQLDQISEFWAHFYRAEAALLENDLRSAIQEYEQVEIPESENMQWNDVLLGLRYSQVLAKVGRLDESANLAAKSAWIGATWIFSNLGNPKAVDFSFAKTFIDDICQATIELEIPEQTTNAWCNWGIAYYRNNLIDEAIEKLEMALARKDHFSEAEASYFLARIYCDRGDIEKATLMQDRCEKSGGYSPNAIDQELDLVSESSD